jgi:hypothetical protein
MLITTGGKGMAQEPRESQEYFSYMVRLWKAADEHGKPVWRATLETPITREVHTFANLGSLFAFLQDQTEPVVDHEGNEGNEEARGNEKSLPGM